jgi:transposase
MYGLREGWPVGMIGHLVERMPMHITERQPTDREELRRRIRQEGNAKQRDRWRAVLLALEGQTTVQIMDKLGRSKNFVQRWVYFYRDWGLERVRPKKQPGQPQRLPAHQQAAFLKRIDQSDQILRGRDIVAILQQEFGVTYSLNGAYELLHRLGYEPLRPRPVNPKKDPQQELAWTASAPLLSRRFVRRIRTRRSRSGSRTSVDSDKRDA